MRKEYICTIPAGICPKPELACDDCEYHKLKEAVNHPSHYASGKYECIDVMCEAIGLEDTKGFCLCNAFKYIYRCTKKNIDTTEDVKKAIWYLNKYLELGEKANGSQTSSAHV